MGRARATGQSASGPSRRGIKTWQRYWLYQVPGLAVVAAVLGMGAHWLGLPGWACWLGVGLWAAKDALLYRFVKAAYEGAQPVGAEALIGSVGVAQDPLAPCGFIRIGPELWKAESAHPVEVGQRIRVTGCAGMVLLVEAVAPRPSALRVTA